MEAICLTSNSRRTRGKLRCARLPAPLNCDVKYRMAERREILERWKFPYLQHYGVTLVSRKDASACIARIFADSCRFHGYDAFTLFPDNKIQPHLDWSPSW